MAFFLLLEASSMLLCDVWFWGVLQPCSSIVHAPGAFSDFGDF